VNCSPSHRGCNFSLSAKNIEPFFLVLYPKQWITMNRSLVWFRNDLRLKDNATLIAALKYTQEVLPVFCFNPSWFLPTKQGFPKMGAFRAQFLLEAVSDLRENIRSIGSDLIVRIGEPQEVIAALCAEWNVNKVFYSEEVTHEELQEERLLQNALNALKVDWSAHWNSTLVNKSDLPFSIQGMPDVFTAFRTRVEREHSFRYPYPAPTAWAGQLLVDPGELPTLSSFGFAPIAMDERSALNFKGGESEAWKRLRHYFWESDSLRQYKETRNGLLGSNYSSKFSPWLALGCISASSIYDEVCKYQTVRVTNESTYWMIFELLWRDFFRFTAAKQKNALFQLNGFGRGKGRSWKRDMTLLKKWMNGQTGDAFVDANMKEVQLTGWMSNRGRQNVASFLVHELGLDWRMGAAYFESQLIDYDVCSNWGNWAYVAGVGNDPRPDRRFNTIRQAAEYDSNGSYRKLWA
jgi:deoxyribodipyrimidine photo-lyase